MCGRFTLTAPPEQVAEALALAEVAPFPPRYNIAPTQPILIVMAGEGSDRPGANLPNRHALLVRWGLIPAWAKDPKTLPLMINARAETAAEKAAFRGPMRYRRCLVPASGFYEWRRRGDAKEPYHIKPKRPEVFAFAGLMETFMAADGSEIDTAAILTTAANDDMAPIHDRMPVVVQKHDHERWLDCRTFGPADVADILSAKNEGFFERVLISDRINRVSNVEPSVQTPVTETEPDTDGKRSGDEQLTLL